MRITFWLLMVVTFGCAGMFASPTEQQSGEPAPSVQGDSKPASSPAPFSWTTEDGEPVIRVANGVTPPRTVKSPDPEYSAAARNARITGVVVLWLVVNAKGIPEQIKVQKSLGYGLDRNAVEAVKKWKFAPAIKDGKPVAVIINVQVNFQL